MPDWCVLTQDDEDAVGAISMVTNAINEKKPETSGRRTPGRGLEST